MPKSGLTIASTSTSGGTEHKQLLARAAWVPRGARSSPSPLAEERAALPGSAKAWISSQAGAEGGGRA